MTCTASACMGITAWLAPGGHHGPHATHHLIHLDGRTETRSEREGQRNKQRRASGLVVRTDLPAAVRAFFLAGPHGPEGAGAVFFLFLTFHPNFRGPRATAARRATRGPIRSTFAVAASLSVFLDWTERPCTHDFTPPFSLYNSFIAFTIIHSSIMPVLTQRIYLGDAHENNQ